MIDDKRVFARGSHEISPGFGNNFSGMGAGLLLLKMSSGGVSDKETPLQIRSGRWWIAIVGRAAARSCFF
jgi:hypothetical protein